MKTDISKLLPFVCLAGLLLMWTILLPPDGRDVPHHAVVPPPVFLPRFGDETREAPAATVKGEDVRAVAGRVSATLDRAKDDARRQLDEDVRAWLAPRVDRSWPLPPNLIDAMVRQVRVAPEEKEYGTVYTAVVDADFGSGVRARLIDAYRRDVARDRTVKLAAALGFVLVCLAAATGYIRADEATRGYYTAPLRMAAAAAVGASGLALYQFLA